MKGWTKMVKCKVAEESKNECQNCCVFCEKKDSCEDVCQEMEEKCEEQVEAPDEIINLESKVPDVIKAISDICTQKKQLEEQEKKMREALQEAMEKFGVKKFENDVIAVTYVAPTTRTSIDSAKLKKEQPDIAQKYSKTSNVSASVKIVVK